MPAPVIKGIIIAVSLITALGIVILENPHVKEWIEEQRRKIAEALRSIGEELDPQSRREAEAFAYEGRLPGESAGVANAVAVATGRDADGTAATRRMTLLGNHEPIDAAERRRLGREYLARRNQEMLDRQRSSRTINAASEKVLPQPSENSEPVPSSAEKTPTDDFASLVNSDGSLKLKEKALPETSTAEPATPARFITEMVGLGNAAWQSLSTGGTNGLQAGSRYANPFGDEFEMSDHSALDRSITPKPPVPPKIALEKESVVSVAGIPSFSPAQHEEDVPENLTYDEQLARALSLSLADTEARNRAARSQREENDPDLVKAIAESLKEAETPRASFEAESYRIWGSEATRGPTTADETQPLVDITPDPPMSVPSQHTGFGNPSTYTALYGLEQQSRPISQRYGENPNRGKALKSDQHSTTDDELYSVSPQPGQARPALVSPMSERFSECAHNVASPEQEHYQSWQFMSPTSETAEASVASSRAAAPQQLIDIDDLAPVTPTSATVSVDQDEESHGFATDSESESFASLPGSEVQLRSDAGSQSSASMVEVEDIDIDSVSSDEDDGIRTPGSWTDVGSEAGDESSRSASETGDAVHV